MERKKRVFVDLSQVINDEKSMYKYVCTERSDGKTTAAIRDAYETYERYKKIPVFCRRHVTDLSRPFLSTVAGRLKKVRPDLGELTFDGSPSKDGVLMKEDGEPRILFAALSRADAIKSAVDFDTHKNLYIDEYDPLNGRYLKDEAEIIVEIYRTIDRDYSVYNDRVENYVLITTNKVRETNPFLSYFHAQPSNGLTRWNGGRLLCLSWRNKNNESAIENSALAEAMAGTRYYDYMFGEALNNNKRFLRETHGRACLSFAIQHNGAKYAIFYGDNGEYVFDYAKTTESQKKPVFGVDFNDSPRNLINSKQPYEVLARIAHAGLLYFASSRVFEELQDLFRQLY